MSKRNNPELETPTAPLYRDINEFIDVMGIKQYRVIEAFGLKRANWFNLKKRHLNDLSLENMHKFAQYFNLPPEKVMALCYMAYIKGISQQKAEEASAIDAEQPIAPDTDMMDADFPSLG
jgi:predicted XRE-type DNA-binding protein